MPGNIFQGVAQLQIFDPDREMALTIWVKIRQQDFQNLDMVLGIERIKGDDSFVFTDVH